MVNRIILTGSKAREELAKGADFLANGVKDTLGPFGQNWFLEKGNRITNDGVSVAREIQLSDEAQDRGATALREAAIKTNDEVGDGTTTAIVLAQAIYHAVSRFLTKDGIRGKRSPHDLIAQVEKERQEITEKLIASATPITTKEELINSAIVSVEDNDLGQLIGDAQWQLGKDGVLLAEESGDKTSSVEFVHGITIDNGFGASQIINNLEKQTLEVEDTRVILTSHTIRDFEGLNKIIEQLARMNAAPITIIARAWTDEAIKMCLSTNNHPNNRVKIYPLNAPYTDMNERMKDAQAVFGGTYFDSETFDIENMQLSDVGFAHKIVARRFSAILTGKEDEKTKERVAKRIEEIQNALIGSTSDFEKKNMNTRIAQLSNGFAVVKVGSASELERKRIFDKVEDAVNAVRAAYQEGTVKGAGLAFKDIAETLPDTYLLKRPICVLNEQIMSSAPDGFVVEDWVRDPVKVLRVALEKACLAASSFATATGVIATERPKQLDQLLRRNMDNTSAGQ